jgi:hypothetical protein
MDQSSADRPTGELIHFNETLAQKFWPGENAVGKHLFSGTTSETTPVDVVEW